MSEYKCESHKLDFACLGCIKAWIARHDKMKKTLINLAHAGMCDCGNCSSCEAFACLRELGFEK
jgi:hypothetical protein